MPKITPEDALAECSYESEQKREWDSGGAVQTRALCALALFPAFLFAASLVYANKILAVVCLFSALGLGAAICLARRGSLTLGLWRNVVTGCLLTLFTVLTLVGAAVLLGCKDTDPDTFTDETPPACIFVFARHMVPAPWVYGSTTAVALAALALNLGFLRTTAISIAFMPAWIGTLLCVLFGSGPTYLKGEAAGAFVVFCIICGASVTNLWDREISSLKMWRLVSTLERMHQSERMIYHRYGVGGWQRGGVLGVVAGNGRGAEFA